jgi:hypothetical protein
MPVNNPIQATLLYALENLKPLDVFLTILTQVSALGPSTSMPVLPVDTVDLIPSSCTSIYDAQYCMIRPNVDDGIIFSDYYVYFRFFQ